jgi:hypothetical protein
MTRGGPTPVARRWLREDKAHWRLEGDVGPPAGCPHSWRVRPSAPRRQERHRRVGACGGSCSLPS